MKIKLEEHFEGSARLVLNFDMREQFYCWDWISKWKRTGGWLTTRKWYLAVTCVSIQSLHKFSLIFETLFNLIADIQERDVSNRLNFKAFKDNWNELTAKIWRILEKCEVFTKLQKSCSSNQYSSITLISKWPCDGKRTKVVYDCSKSNMICLNAISKYIN
jgi:hypothetical protein